MLISELPEWFRATKSYKAKAWETQRQYGRMVDRMPILFGASTPVGELNAEAVDEAFMELEAQSGAHAAVTFARVARRVYNLLRRYQHATHNPFEKMELPGLPSRSNVPTLEELYTFIAGCQKIGLPSLGLLAEMCYVFCQRPIDMRMLQWKSYAAPILKFEHVKTGTLMVEHVPEFMQDILDAKERVSDFIIVREDTQQPYGRNDYGKLVAEVRRIMQMNESFQLRDLRRMGLTEAGDNEATDQEIDALSGHKSPQMRSIYTRRTYKQSRNAMLKRFGAL